MHDLCTFIFQLSLHFAYHHWWLGIYILHIYIYIYILARQKVCLVGFLPGFFPPICHQHQSRFFLQTITEFYCINSNSLPPFLTDFFSQAFFFETEVSESPCHHRKYFLSSSSLVMQFLIYDSCNWEIVNYILGWRGGDTPRGLNRKDLFFHLCFATFSFSVNKQKS